MDFYFATVQNDVLIIRADGDLNARLVEPLVAELSGLIDGGMRKIIVDCARLDNVSSYGLGVLIRLHTKMAKHGGNVKLCQIKGVIAKVLNITKLDKLLEIYPDVDAAMEAFDQEKKQPGP
jgi:anti-anti-sigma factor